MRLATARAAPAQRGQRSLGPRRPHKALAWRGEEEPWSGSARHGSRSRTRRHPERWSGPVRTRMERDPELDVTLSNGRRLVTFQITALDRDLGAWTVVEPPAPRRVVLGETEALATRQHLDARIAARLAAGWVPVDAGPAEAPAVPLPSDLALQLSSLLAAVTGERVALRAADPSGQLWAACVTFLRQAQRFGVAAPETRFARAQRERRLGELAEQAGDRAGAILHYRAALAAHARVGVRRRLAALEGATSVARLRTHRACLTKAIPFEGSSQLACRIDPALHARARAHAARAGQTLRTFVMRALEQATTGRSTRVR